MRVQVEVDLTCNKVTKDEMAIGPARDEIYFLVASAAGGAETGTRTPSGDPGYIGFRGDAPAKHLHLPLWSGGVGSEPVKLGIIVMEQDNDTLGESATKSLEALLDTLAAQTGTVGTIASALAPIIKGIIRLFANKHDVVGSITLVMKEETPGNVSVQFAAANSSDPAQVSTTFNGTPSPTEGTFKLTGGGSNYDAVFRVF